MCSSTWMMCTHNRTYTAIRASHPRRRRWAEARAVPRPGSGNPARSSPRAYSCREPLALDEDLGAGDQQGPVLALRTDQVGVSAAGP